MLGVGFFAREQLKILLWRDGVFVPESVPFVIVRYHQHDTVGPDARTQSDVLFVRFGVPYALIHTPPLGGGSESARTNALGVYHAGAFVDGAGARTNALGEYHVGALVLVNLLQHLCSSNRAATIARHCHDSRCHHIR